MLSLMPPLMKQSRTPIYLQLYTFIKEEILSGRLQAGCRLPPIRELAHTLSISKNTVSTAYQQLIAEGYAASKDRSGLYITMHSDSFSDSMAAMIAVPEKIWRRPDPDEHVRCNFYSGPIDTSAFPVDIWKKCLLDALYSPVKNSLGYSTSQGDYELREELAEYLFQSRGIPCSPDQIFLSSGTQHSLSLLCQYLQLSGQSIAMENPGFRGTRVVFQNLGCSLDDIPLDDDGIGIDQLYASSAGMVYVTPSHQFPMGMVMPVHRRQQLLQWAHERKAWIIEDDYDSEFRYHGEPIPAMKAMDSYDRVIYLGTLSKIFLPSARLSYIVVPRSLVAVFQQKNQFYNQSVSLLVQHAVHLFMRDGHFTRHVRRMRKIYQSKYEVLTSAIGRFMNDNVTILGHNAGLHLLLKLNAAFNGADLFRAARDAGIMIEPVTNHWSGPEDAYANTFILGFGALSAEELEDGIQQLAEMWFGSE
ncbi:PLP-dependent aminotransferase family protein [Paenibacillus oenotherae]|uniref:PLP-dependent aminotransferase family protein n=1 Tax=Paenibacillus oenotherae TaxID=1435645 RepID=A0ABS7D9P8_9BACL|nr:PLP-dependent aminotransferase family protein [Paenibacillus oenotherae]MBW7475898.1 PLP-dependent aminotransferase family protein [Paenibacillus oenotherae]